jgi:uncharacterized membrane protein SpoIIM required for sporulation
MKLAVFEAQGRERWNKLSLLLDRLEQRGEVAGAEVSELPALYRHVCNDLALARDRQLSSGLVAELNELALRGHRLLYQARTREWSGVGHFLLDTFPRAVRREWRLLLACHLLFYGLALGFGALSYRSSDLIYSFIDEGQVREIEHMYDPDGGLSQESRSADSDAKMFGFYIWNNVSIAFRTFASGLAFGVGAVASLVFNGVFFGLIAAHLVHTGAAHPFFSFVIAHGAFELTAILLSGVAGMRLGLALLAPGAQTRLSALRAAAQRSLPIITGAALMLTIAAGLEAFWSPRVLPVTVKYSAGASLWLVVALWLGLAGRSSGD